MPMNGFIFGSGLGDVYAVAKIALLEGSVSCAHRASRRVLRSTCRAAAFSEGRYLGMGLSLDQKLSEGAAYHIDIRATRVLDDLSPWNLPLRPWTYAFSVGPELRLPKSSSFNLQFDASSTPYRPASA